MENKWTITFRISRQKVNQKHSFQSFQIEVDPDEYVLDGIERIWAFHDRSLVFRHACHHSTCGACAMLVNGVEKLTCITPIRSVTHPGGTVKVEPLRNFPVVSDLMVDMTTFYRNMEMANAVQVATLEHACLPFERHLQPSGNFERLVDCIECGMCVSACPAANTSSTYLGPGTLAALHLSCVSGEAKSVDIADTQDGIWRCHSGFECSEVCPSNVDPALRIMDLRRRVITAKIKGIFQRREKTR